jgi:AGZA family xanthine/uracil permease-like MFS transporter
MTILFGVIARLPFALAAGLGINSFLAVSVVGQVTWQEAMGLVVINGVLIVLFGATGIRTAIFKAVPRRSRPRSRSASASSSPSSASSTPAS